MMSNSTIFNFHTRKENQPQESKHNSTSSLSVLSSYGLGGGMVLVKKRSFLQFANSFGLNLLRALW